MTPLQRAKKLFGKTATAERRFCNPYEELGKQKCPCLRKDCQSLHWWCSVGRVVLGMFNEINGEGETWDEAFARAEARVRRNA